MVTYYWPSDWPYNADLDQNAMKLMVSGVERHFWVNDAQQTWSITNPGNDDNAIRFEVRHGDQWHQGNGNDVSNNNTAERSELGDMGQWTQNDLVYISYDWLCESVLGQPADQMLPDWYFCDIGQWHGWNPTSAQIYLSWGGDKVRVRFDGNWADENKITYGAQGADTGPVPRDIWYHFDWQIKAHATAGRWKLTRTALSGADQGNPHVLIDFTGAMPTGGSANFYWKMGIYRGPTYAGYQTRGTLPITYKNLYMSTTPPAVAGAGTANAVSTAVATSYTAPLSSEVVSRNTGACQAMNMLFTHLKLNGMVPFYYFMLADTESGSSSFTNHYGFFDYSWNPKPVAYCIKTIMQYLGDATLVTDFDVVVSGIDTDAQTGEKHLLFKKTDGSYAVVIWVEPDIWNEGSAAEIIPSTQEGNLTIGVNVENCVLVDPFPTRSTNHSIQNLGSGNLFDFTIVDHPLIFLFTPRSPSNPPTLKELLGVLINFANYPTYNTVANITNGMNYLGLNRLRDSLNFAHANPITYFDQLVSAGFKFSFYYGYHTDGWLSITNAVNIMGHIEGLSPGTIEVIESGNDIDTHTDFTYGGQTSYNAWKLFQADYWNAIKANPSLAQIKIAAPSLQDITTAATLGDVNIYCDYGDMDYTCKNGQPTWDALVSTTKWSDVIDDIKNYVVAQKPVMVSKYGATNLTTDANGVSERAAACQIMNAIFVFLKQNGATKMFLFKLMDDEAGMTVANSHYGLFYYNSANPKPVATCIRTIVQYMGDAVLNSDFSVDITGLDTDELTGKKVLLFKKNSDNSHIVVVWVEPDIWNEGTKADINAPLQTGTLTLSVSTRCTLVDPYPNHSITPSVVDKGSGSSFQFTIQDHPLIFVLTGAQTPNFQEGQGQSFGVTMNTVDHILSDGNNAPLSDHKTQFLSDNTSTDGGKST